MVAETPAKTPPRKPAVPVVLLMGLTCFAIGAFLLAGAAGMLPARAHTHTDAPRWVVGCIGLVLLAGAFAPVNAVYPLPDGLNRLVGFTGAAGLARVFNWEAFFPGERHFTASSFIPGLQAGGAASALAGRTVFGFAALFADALVVWGLWRQWRGARPPPRG